MRLSILGTQEQDCPELLCPIYQCYQECEHRGIVFDLLDNLPFQSQLFLTNLIDAFLEVQEEFLQELCSPVDDICELGFRVNLDCLQCALTTIEIVPSDCDGYDIVNETSAPTFINLSDAAYFDYYNAIISWLMCARGNASGELIDSLAQALGGELLGFSNRTYHIRLPNDPVLLGISNLIKRIMPVPFGAAIEIYTES